MINLYIVEDDKTTRESLVEYTSFYPAINLIAAVDSAEEGLSQLRQSPEIAPDVLLLDIGLPGISGIESIPSFKIICPNIDVVMFTTYEEEEKIFAALCAGACSYISKRTPLKVIMESIKIIAEGGSYMSPLIARKIAEKHYVKTRMSTELTTRQMDVVHGLVDGLSYQGIADKLFISIDTVRVHIKNIYKILQINSSLELVNKFHGQK